jgi:hypothetical protein
LRKPRIDVLPTGDALASVVGRRASPERLEMVAQGKEHVTGALRPWSGEIVENMPAIPADPAKDVFVRKREREHGIS